ncbi:MAG: DUF4286 family protein [Tannerellaceae bacterium]|jgi:hypothetical protein|nr:DUF4286 family protein [Tannerellaceae bacterium]
MIVYNTTFHIDNDILDATLSYLKKTYIPKAIESGLLHSPCLHKVLHTADNGENYAIQFRTKNIDTLNYWLEKEGKTLHQSLLNLFGSKIAGFTTLLEEINWEI